MCFTVSFNFIFILSNPGYQKELENGDISKLMADADASPEFKMLMDALTKLDGQPGTFTTPLK